MSKPTDPNRMRELGRRGGKASGEARRKRANRSLLDVLRGRIAENPEALVDQLLASPAGAVKVAALLERAGGLEPDAPQHDDGSPPAVRSAREPTSFPDIVAFAARQGPSFEHAWFGFELTHEQRAVALERWERGEAARDREGEGVPPAGEPHMESPQEPP